MKKNVLLCLTAITFLQATTVYAQTLVKNMSAASGNVYAVYKKGNGYYIGGDFTYVGLNTGYAALTKTNNDYPNMDFPRFDGQIYALIPDGTGGWYAGGNFGKVGGVQKSYLAHIKSDNTVDAGFTANTNGLVRTIAKVGNRLYIGGDFTTVNGSARLYAGAVSASTGALVNGWNPAPSYSVYSIAPAFGVDTTIWLGGNFQTVNTPAILRPYLAKVNSTNGAFVSGSLSANYIVNKVTTRGDSVFVGGAFTRLGLKTDYLASITEGSNVGNQTMPNANGTIRCIIPDGTGGWYVGGSFNQIGGISKSYVAHIKSDKTVDAGFTATCNGAVYAIVKDGTRLYIGGEFNSVNSTPRNYLAAVSASTGALVAGWDANANNAVYTLVLKDTTVMAGGTFTTIKGFNAFRFASLKKTDGSPVGGFYGYNNRVNKIALGPSDSLLVAGYYSNAAYYSPYSARVTTSNVKPDPKFPATNGQIYSVVPDGTGNYYVGGSFSQIGGVNQPYLAKLNSSFQVVTGWAPVVNGVVRTIVVKGTTVYIGGSFSQTNTVSRLYISALGTANPGANKTWNSAMNSYVYSMVTDGTSIYAGGLFTTVNGSTSRGLLAKFDVNGNLDASWNPNATGGGGSVEKLAFSGTNILAGGSFTTIGGNARNYLAKLNTTNGAATNWAKANSYVYALYVDGTTCYAGGYFTQLISTGGTMTPRNYVGAITISNGNIGAFNPNPNSYVMAITKSGSNLYYGGNFTNINGTTRYYLAASATSNSSLQSWNPAANNAVNALYIDASNVFIGGSFTGFQEVSRSYASIQRYSTQGLASWTPVIDNVVYDITANATKIFIGGVFHNVSGSARNGLAAFSLKGAVQATNLALTKNGSTSVAVWSLFATTTKLYAGGDFDMAGASLRNDFVEADISAGAGTVSATDASPDEIVYAINVQGTNIAYGGDFRFSNLAKRNYLALIKKSTGKILPFAPSPDSYVSDISVNYNKIFIVGQFDNVNGAAHPGAAAFNKANGALLSWNPVLSRAGQGYYADLYSVYADSNNVYLGGYFDKVGATTRYNAAVVAATNASLLTWDPGPNTPSLNGIVRAIAVNGINLFIGGDFNFCKGAQRNYVAKIDSATGLVNTSWNPGCNGYVYAITGSGTSIYIGGSFSQLGGVTRTSLGSVSSTTGAATSFDPVIQSGGGQGTVRALAFDAGGVLYAGGNFNMAKGSTRNNLAAFATAGAGTLKPWDPNASTEVYALAAIGTQIFVGGSFTQLNGGQTRHYLAAVNNTNGTVTTFNPDMGSYVWCLSFNGNNLYAGGQFSTVKGGTTSRSYMALYDASTGALKTWNPIANSYVYGIAVSGDTVYPSGAFSLLNGSGRTYAGAVRGAAGTTTLSFNPALGNVGRNNFISEHTLLIGGGFLTAGGDIRSGFAVYDLPGSQPLQQSDNTDAEQYVQSAASLQNQFAVYPNPARGVATVKLQNSVSGKLSVTLTDMNGKKVLQQVEEGDYLNYIKLNTSTLKNGTYVITVSGKDINLSSLIVVAN